MALQNTLNNKITFSIFKKNLLLKMATTLYSTLLHRLHSKICILHYTLQSALCTLHSALCTLHSALCTLHSALFISGCQGTLLLSPNAIEETAVFIDQGGKRNNLIIFTIYVVAFLHSSRKETEKDWIIPNIITETIRMTCRIITYV